MNNRRANREGFLARTFTAAVLLLMLASGTAAAEVLSLPEAVQKALENNHELKAYRNAHAAKEADIGLARSLLLPRISLEERYLRTVNPTYAFMTRLNQERIGTADFAPDALNRPEAVNDYQTSLTVEQPLYVRKFNIGLEMSKTESMASEKALQRKREEIAFRVVQSYLTAETAGEYLRVAQGALEDAREHRRLALARYEAGLGLYSDILRAGTAVTEAEQKLVSARKRLAVAKLALGLMVGSGEAVELSGAKPSLPIRDIEDLRSRSQARRDIMALELRKENAENQVRLANAGYFPYLGMGGAYQMNDRNAPLGREGDNWQFMAFLKWELFDGTKRKYERIKADHQVSELGEQLEGMKKQVSFQVEEAWLTLEEARKNLELAKESLRTAEEGRRLVRARYEGSLSPIVDMLDAQLSRDHAAANLVAQENEYQIAIAYLCYASGTIMADLQLEEPKGETR